MCSWIRNIENKYSVIQQRTNLRIARQCTNERPLFVLLFVICYLLFVIFCISEWKSIYNFYYIVYSTNMALRLRCGFTWCSYFLICMFLCCALCTIVFLFVLFISTIVLSVCLWLTAIGDPFDIFGNLYYPWVCVMSLVFLIILEGSF